MVKKLQFEGQKRYHFIENIYVFVAYLILILYSSLLIINDNVIFPLLRLSFIMEQLAVRRNLRT